MALEVHQEGVDLFDGVVSELPQLLAELQKAPGAKVSEHPQIPEEPGIYLFSEGDRALYVGQTRKLRQRLRNHTRLLGKNNQATFAFLVAKSEAEAAGLDTKKFRDQLESDQDFIEHFDAAKARVSQMTVRFLTIPGPIERSVFEMYAAMALDTMIFNSFETH